MISPKSIYNPKSNQAHEEAEAAAAAAVAAAAEEKAKEDKAKEDKAKEDAAREVALPLQPYTSQAVSSLPLQPYTSRAVSSLALSSLAFGMALPPQSSLGLRDGAASTIFPWPSGWRCLHNLSLAIGMALPPQSLHWLRSRLCSHIPSPTQNRCHILNTGMGVG